MVERIARLAGTHRGHVVVDVGCGIGGPARRLARIAGCRVIGVDVVEDVVRRAAAHRRRGAGPRSPRRRADPAARAGEAAVKARAVEFAAPRSVRVIDLDVPDEPGPGEVLVRTELSGISGGTEMLAYRGE